VYGIWHLLLAGRAIYEYFKWSLHYVLVGDAFDQLNADVKCSCLVLQVFSQLYLGPENS